MKLNSIKFGIACAVSASILWLICTLLVMVMPGVMMTMSGDMVHMQLSDMEWQISLSGVILGMVGWFMIAGAMGGASAVIYNRLD